MPYCPKCGKEVKEDARFCPNCGQVLPTAVAQPVPQATPVTKQRPEGIIILAVLEVLGGLVFLVLGAILMIAAGIIGGGDFGSYEGMFPAFVAVFIGSVGFIMVVIGILSFVIAYGYWNGLGWAWNVGLVFAILGIIISLILLPGSILRLLLDVLIIYYLTRPHVKRYFGKEPVTITM